MGCAINRFLELIGRRHGFGHRRSEVEFRTIRLAPSREGKSRRRWIPALSRKSRPRSAAFGSIRVLSFNKPPQALANAAEVGLGLAENAELHLLPYPPTQPSEARIGPRASRPLRYPRVRSACSQAPAPGGMQSALPPAAMAGVGHSPPLSRASARPASALDQASS
jgi:hypothetical protein